MLQRLDIADRRFFLLTLVLIFLAHATAYLCHDYAHALVAWSLGWMPAPKIEYGRPTLSNLLFQQNVGDGVRYAPIFAGGHGGQAALIAFAGPGIGNGLLYLVCDLAIRRTPIRHRPSAAMPLFWLAVMCAGNVWSYAPMRTITTHADMAIMARGLGISTWLLLPLVGAPSLLIMWSFFTRLLPFIRRLLFARGGPADTFLTLMACFFYFVFFGYDGLDNGYGEVSALLSIASMFVVFPLTTMACLYNQPVPAPTTQAAWTGLSS